MKKRRALNKNLKTHSKSLNQKMFAIEDGAQEMNCVEYMERLHEGKLLVLDPDYNLNEPYIPGNFR